MRTFVRTKEFGQDGYSTPRTVTIYGELRERKISGVRTKEFAMGWSICSQGDTFDEDTGVKLAKSRLDWKKALRTTNGSYLCPDMCEAIIDNEIDYIGENWQKKVVAKKKPEYQAPEVITFETESNNTEETENTPHRIVKHWESPDGKTKVTYTEVITKSEPAPKTNIEKNELVACEGLRALREMEETFNNFVSLLGVWL